MSIIFAILFFSFLIFIHEFGHFIAAKASGVQVNEFSIFMGPALFKKQIGETLYAIRTIPIGGYCAMEGEDSDTENPRSFRKAAWWKRLIILAAGSFMNFIVGILMFAIILGCAYSAYPITTVDSFTECSTVCGDSKFLPGDTILSIDGEKLYVVNDFSVILELNSKQETHHVVVERNGKEIDLGQIKIEPHECTDNNGKAITHYGISFRTEEKTFLSTVKHAWLNTVDTIWMVRVSLQMLFTGKASVTDLSGPVGIVDIMTQTANASASIKAAILNLMNFAAYIAVNLAVMNLLPIPALDGGRIATLLITTAIEAVTKKKIDPKYEGYIHTAFMILLFGLMILIVFKDVFTIVTR